MNWLLWREYRRNRSILGIGAVFILLIYVPNFVRTSLGRLSFGTH